MCQYLPEHAAYIGVPLSQSSRLLTNSRGWLMSIDGLSHILTISRLPPLQAAYNRQLRTPSSLTISVKQDTQ